ncbi:MAG: hypothetical protein Q7R30_08895 [Acidobacteriota bacterium]|nr:hypothetical protein [Acidobacteriota bacterium]
MSDLDDYKRDQDLFFQELEERQRRSERLITEEEFAEDVHRAGIDVERIDGVARQLRKLGRMAGMSDAASTDWAFKTIWAGVRKRIERNWHGTD